MLEVLTGMDDDGSPSPSQTTMPLSHAVSSSNVEVTREKPSGLRSRTTTYGGDPSAFASYMPSRKSTLQKQNFGSLLSMEPPNPPNQKHLR